MNAGATRLTTGLTKLQHDRLLGLVDNKYGLYGYNKHQGSNEHDWQQCSVHNYRPPLFVFSSSNGR